MRLGDLSHRALAPVVPVRSVHICINGLVEELAQGRAG